MTPRKLAKLKQELASFRRSQAKAADLESLASRLGRKQVKRGKEPTWESLEFNELFPLAIPHHGGRDLPIGTRRNILDQLEHDVFAWEKRLDQEKMTRATTERQMSAAAPGEYLKRPYGRVVVPEPDGTFRAEIMEFPGCIATGDTAAEALASLENVAESWLEATIARGQHVPEPIEGGGFSGKLVVRLGRDLHRRAAHMAAHEDVSLNQFIVSSVAEHVGGRLAVGQMLRMATLPSLTTAFVYPGQLSNWLPYGPSFIRSTSPVTEQIDA